MSEFSSPTLVRAVGAVLFPFAAAVAGAQDGALARTDSTPFAPVAIEAPALRTVSADAASTGTVTHVAGPTIDGAATAARLPRSADRDLARRNIASDDRPHAGRAAALMVTGGAAIVLGALVGGDAEAPLIVGGAVIGLIGLYDWVK